ncbi:MAG: NAD(P)/FAD-dependent oxidoreductase [Peptostreptococcaceae bacterium]|nr:NAD(P)/FAD-dependent oxidoreductase [Peptostreptococcaceae bacterium]
MYDYTIIGAGINGCFLAHELSKYDLDVLVLEKGPDVASGATMANSAIVHAGHDPKPGTLKAKLNVRGNELYPSICKEMDAAFKLTSAFVVATNEAELSVIHDLHRQSQTRNIPSEVLNRSQAMQLEPNLSDSIIAALDLPSTGIITPWEVAFNLMEEAILNDVKLNLNTKVLSVMARPRTCYIDAKCSDSKYAYEIITNKGNFIGSNVINAAGVYADEIYSMLNPSDKFTITGRKGEYFILDKLSEPIVNRVIYPIPSEKGKGVLVVPTIHGNTLLGPSSEFIDNKNGDFTDTETLEYVRSQVKKTVKNIPFNKVIKTFAGLRPTGPTGDFIIGESIDYPGFVNIAAIESPGLASAPATCEYVMDTIIEKQVILKKKKTYIKRAHLPILYKMADSEKQKLWKDNPSYGKIVCRCEHISEGEIIDSIRRPLGATTLDGVKKRVRPSMGRCQGSFCQPAIIEILAKELNLSVEEVKLYNEGSNVVIKGEFN